MKRLLISLLILTLSLALFACGGDESQAATETTDTTATTATAAPALPSDVAEVAAINTAGIETATAASSTANANTFEATGEFVSPVRSELSPKLPGRVAKMFVAEGSRVTRGQPVLQLATEQLQAAQAEYDQAFDLYRAQEATSLDVAASETSLADARRAVAEETLNRDLAQLRVWHAAGAMKDALNDGVAE